MTSIADAIVHRPELLKIAPRLAFTCRQLLAAWNAVYRWGALDAAIKADPPVCDMNRSSLGDHYIYKQPVRGMPAYKPIYYLDAISTRGAFNFGVIQSYDYRGHMSYTKYDPFNKIGINIHSVADDSLARAGWRRMLRLPRAELEYVVKAERDALVAAAARMVTILVYDPRLESQSYILEDEPGFGILCCDGLTYVSDAQDVSSLDPYGERLKYVAGHYMAILAYIVGDSLNICDYLPDIHAAMSLT